MLNEFINLKINYMQGLSQIRYELMFIKNNISFLQFKSKIKTN